MVCAWIPWGRGILAENSGENGEGLGDLVGGDHQAGHGAERIGAEAEDADARRFEGFGEGGGGEGYDAEEDDIGLDAGGVELDAGESA